MQQQEALAAERARLAQEGATFNSEKERFTAEKAEHERQMKMLADTMAARENDLNKREALDAVEKEFAEKANAIDVFVVTESGKVVGATSMQALEPIQRFGVDHGQGLLDGLRDCGERAMHLGLAQNRFTKHTLKSLEERWAVFKRDLEERARSFIASQYPSAPDYSQQNYPAPPQQSQYPQAPQQSQYGAGSNYAPPPRPADAPIPGLGMPPRPSQQVPGLGNPNSNRPPQAPQQYGQQYPPQQQQQQYPPPQQQMQQMQYPQQQQQQLPPRVNTTVVHHHHQAPATRPTVVVAPQCESRFPILLIYRLLTAYSFI